MQQPWQSFFGVSVLVPTIIADLGWFVCILAHASVPMHAYTSILTPIVYLIASRYSRETRL